MTARRAVLLGTLLLAASARADDFPKFDPKAQVDAPTVEGKALESTSPHDVPANITVAFFGDSGTSSRAKDAMDLAKSADVLIHLGDFDYEKNPDAFDDLLKRLDSGETKKPVFAAIGNHEFDGGSSKRVREYIGIMKGRTKDAACDDRSKKAQTWDDKLGSEPRAGFKRACKYKGLMIVTLAVKMGKWGEKDDVYAQYIDEQLSASTAKWKICAFHKPAPLMQPGGNGDGPRDWQVYEACRKHGAIIATGHEHGYGRTHVIEAFADKPTYVFPPGLTANTDKTCDGEDVKTAYSSEQLTVEKGKTFAFVSGAGGATIRGSPWCDPCNAKKPWLARFHMRPAFITKHDYVKDDEDDDEGEDEGDDEGDGEGEEKRKLKCKTQPKFRESRRVSKATKKESGVLFCKFSGATADCVYKIAQDGRVIDEFTISSKL